MNEFFKDLQTERQHLCRVITRILIEGIGLQNNNVHSILSNFVCLEHPREAKMRILSIGNLYVSKELINLIFTKMLP